MREIQASAKVADTVVSTGAQAPAALTEPGTDEHLAALTGVLPGPDGPCRC